MSEIARLHDQLQRSYRGPAWHGPSILEILKDVNAETAERKRGDTHSIAELVRHIAAWEAFATETLHSAEYSNLPPEKDWAPSHGSWEADLAYLEQAQRTLEEAVLAFPESRLDERVKNSHKYTYYFLLHGVIQHNLYHAGQIAILKK